MTEYILICGAIVARVIHKDHYDDKAIWLVMTENNKLTYVPAKDCTPLDPALNVLFERNEDETQTGD